MRILVASNLVVVAACGQTAPESSVEAGRRIFNVGPPPRDNGKDERYRVSIARKYLAQHDQADGVVAVTQVTFAVSYPTFDPVSQAQLGGSNVVILSAVWERPGSIRQRWDGSWQNHFTLYNRQLPDRWGLRVRQSANYRWDNSIILYAQEGRETLIECPFNVTPEKATCVMLFRARGNAVIEATFSDKILPKWRNIQASALALYSF